MILRQTNFLGQMRIDAPMLRGMESSVAADFDMLVGRAMAGSQPLIVRGFEIIMTGAVGAQASALLVDVADGIAVNQNASESGSMLWVPGTRAPEQLSTTNPKVTGSFTASQTNFVGLDFTRSADDSTVDSVQFIDPNTAGETTKTVPLARTLDYRLVITSNDFSSQPNILPIAKVVTDSNNNVVSVEDARNLMFRLGSGGDFPNIGNTYPWPGSRLENTSGDVFAGGDKAIGNLGDWMKAAMTRIWEVGGGEYWYSATADRNVNMVFTGVPFVGGEYFEWNGTHLHWKGVRFVFDNSTGTFNDVKDQTTDSSGLTNLADGECLYVDLNRGINATGLTALQAAKGPLSTLGTGSKPGQRTILAWRVGSNVFYRGWRFPVGSGLAAATTSTLGVVRLNGTPANVASPQVVTVLTDGRAEVIATAGSVAAITGKGAPLASNSTGVFGQGGAVGNGIGVHGQGTGSQPGGFFESTGLNTTALIATATAGNAHGAEISAVGEGRGVIGLGGTNNGALGPNNINGSGGYFKGADGTAGGRGITAIGGDGTTRPGGVFIGGSHANGGDGIRAEGTGTTGRGGSFTSVGGVGIEVVSSGGAQAGLFTNNAVGGTPEGIRATSNFIGVRGIATGGIGVRGEGSTGVRAEGTTNGLIASTSSTSQNAVIISDAPGSTRAALNIPIRTSTPGSFQDGDVWVQDTGGVRTFNARIGGVTYSVTLT